MCSLLFGPDPDLAKPFDRVVGQEVFRLVKLPHLDLGVFALARGIGKPLGPFQGFLPRLDPNE